MGASRGSRIWGHPGLQRGQVTQGSWRWCGRPAGGAPSELVGKAGPDFIWEEGWTRLRAWPAASAQVAGRAGGVASDGLWGLPAPVLTAKLCACGFRFRSAPRPSARRSCLEVAIEGTAPHAVTLV